MNVPSCPQHLDWIALIAALATVFVAAAAFWSAKVARDAVKAQAEAAAIAVKSQAETAATAVLAQADAAESQIKAAIEVAALQSRASVVSASRQRWIDALRDDIAEFLTVDGDRKGFDRSPSIRPEINIATMREADQLLARETLLLRRIRLRLNPNEEAHIVLLGRLDALVLTKQFESVAAADEIIGLTQSLLKAEWERVKREASGQIALSTPAIT